MAVLLVLLLSFIISIVVTKVVSGDLQYILSGNISMCIMLCFTATGHFKFSSGMEKMIPKFIPRKKEIVFLTGILEFVAGLALLLPDLRSTTGVLLILFFILIVPANINAAIQHVDYQKGTNDGKGLKYLWFRIPMQIILIVWVWFFSVRI